VRTSWDPGGARSAFALSLALLLLSVLLGLSFPAACPAKSYSIPEVTIEATVRPGGDMVVRETRVFDFSGDFSFAYWDLEEAGSSGIEVRAVIGPEGEYARTDDPGSRPPRTWSVYGEGSGVVHLEVYFRAVDVRLPITIEYVVRDAASKWDDTAELYWKFIGDEWDHGVGRVEIHVTMPPGVEQDEVRAWGHGP